MDFGLAGKTALVTGSTDGIGFAIASGLAREGAGVWITGRTQEGVASAVGAIRESCPGTTVEGVSADLNTVDGIASVAARVPEVDILVNSLGAVNARKGFEELADAEWQELFDINVMSGVRITRQYIGGLRKRSFGRIVFVSSEAAIQVPTDLIHYGMTKAANIAIARGIAEMFVGTGVTVNTVIPGPTKARGLKKRIAASGRSEQDYEAEFFRDVRPTSLIKRFTSTDEIANLVVYLCSAAASGTHGAAIRVEGGILKSAF